MANFYVDASRPDDSGAGTSEATAKQTIPAGIALLSPGDKLYIKVGTYTITSTVEFDAHTYGGTSWGGRTIIEGYHTTPGDRAGKPLITSATNSVAIITIKASSTGSKSLELISLHCQSTASTRGNGIVGVTGVGSDSTATMITDCLVEGCALGISEGSRLILYVVRTSVINGTNTGISLSVGNLLAYDCYCAGNGGHGISMGGNSNVSPTIAGCVLVNNASCGFIHNISTRTGRTHDLRNNICAGNGSHGISIPASTGNSTVHLYGNICYGNGGYGFYADNSNWRINDQNAFGGNTSGDHSGWDDGNGKITLTADPFVDSSSGDFNINTASGGGALLRAAQIVLGA